MKAFFDLDDPSNRGKQKSLRERPNERDIAGPTRRPGATSINFEKQQDGLWRSQGLLPDEKMLLTVEAKGFQSWSKSLTLAEGATEEVEARLEKQ